MEEESSRFFIAIHVGAGYHAPSNEKSLKSAMNRACLAAASILQKGSHPCSCLDAVSAAIKVLEDEPCTNVGRGSNLTEDEDVECDASVMDGDSGAFGAVGAVPGVRNPIEIATLLAKEQMMGSSLLGRIPPMFLVGEGARKWAKSKGLISPVTEEDTEWLVTERAKAQWLKYRRMLDDAKARSDPSRKLSPSSPKVMILDTTSGPNKKILCQLSMLERRMAQGTENQMQLIEDSIRHAKEAILLDVEDGNSWYNLGNAYLTSFFATGSRHHKKLLESLKAYQHAEKDEAMQSNPDLYFNSATVNKYLENYERALTGFQAAALKDPGLNATEEVQKMVTLLDNLANCSKVLRTVFGSKVKGKRAVSLTSSLSDMNLNTSLKKATVKQLSEGLNKDVVVLAKVLQYIKYNDVAPLYYLMCDLEQSYFILSVYGVRPDVIKEGDQLTIVVPYFRDVNFSWNSKKYEFKSIRVDFSEQITVNGKTLGKDHAVPTSVSVEHKP